MRGFHRRRCAPPAAWVLLIGSTVLGTGCEGEGVVPRIVAGPAVPSPIPLQAPYIWQGEQGLDIWRRNAVSRGPLTLVGAGDTAFLRLDPTTSEWVARGPDLEPPAVGLGTMRIRYRWVPDPQLQPGATRTFSVSALFETEPPLPNQPYTFAALAPATDWTDFSFPPPYLLTTRRVRYAYLHAQSNNRGVFDIARIELAP